MKKIYSRKASNAQASDIGKNTNLITATDHNIVHCRASGSKLKADSSPDWVQDEPVKVPYMPAGLHTITAGFCGPITKGRAASINLTVEVDPDRDAATCQASLDNLLKESPRQMPYMCFEHDEKQASLWASSFASGLDPVFNEPAIILTGKPSGSGAKAVNAKDWRSTSPSFGTNAEYTKCKCRRCDDPIKVCACEKPAFYFPDGVRGSEANPAQITGIDFVVGTLTNKPAFRAMPPVKAKLEDGTVQAGGPGSGRRKEGESKSEVATTESQKATKCRFQGNGFWKSRRP